MNIKEIRQMPTVIDATDRNGGRVVIQNRKMHESLFRAYSVLDLVRELLALDVHSSVIQDIIALCYEDDLGAAIHDMTWDEMFPPTKVQKEIAATDDD